MLEAVSLPRHLRFGLVLLLGGVAWFDHCANHRVDRSDARRIRAHLVRPAAEVNGLFAPTAPIDHLAGPAITSPTTAVAGFSLFPLAQVAGVVEARVVRQVLLTRHGGRHGP